ncbi:sulfurtransferase [Paenibacillus filicis]|uniref:thiosulfate sulfurtransferase n=1 Tax=Paenibacillus filicis TaxID=669464 RepID=A0ABU9DH09_9BACL
MKTKLSVAALLALAVLASACGTKPAATTTNAGSPAAAPAVAEKKPEAKAPQTYPNAQLLADVKWAEEHAKDANVKILDLRAKGYEQGHIPGAIAFNAGQLKDAKNNTIVGKDKFTEIFQGLGLNSDTTVLLYDEGNSNGATRVFYALEYYGHKDKVKLLNGGYAAWQAAGKDVSTDAPAAAAAKGNFNAVPNDKLITTKEQLQKNDLQGCVLLDVRSSKEFSGEDLRGNQNGGHLKNAVNKEWSESIEQNAADGVPKFKSYEELKASFEKIGVVKDKTVIPYCQTNVRGAHTYFTLRLLGYSDIAPYEGSWAEWGNAGDTEIVK